MNGTKKSAYFSNENLEWIDEVQKKEGFNFSQTVNWILKKAKDKKNHKK